MTNKATQRLTVSGDGSIYVNDLLYGISAKMTDKYLQVPPRLWADKPPHAPMPTEDGVYLLIDNVWVR